MNSARTISPLRTEAAVDEDNLKMLLRKKGVFPIHLSARLKDIAGLPQKRPAFISGPVGSGKTYLAVAYLADSMARALTTHPEREAAGAGFIRAIDLFMQIRGSFKDGGPEWLIENFSRFKFLVIDDLGTERDTPLVQEVIYAILDYRVGHLLPTIVTSNFSLDRIAVQYGDYGERIASRLAGLGPSLTLKGRDRRWQK